MAGRLSLKAKTAMLEEYKAGPLPGGAVEELRKLLADTNHHVVSDAAYVAEKYSLRELIPDLEAAFDRLIPGGVKADKGCLAKSAIVSALDELEYEDRDNIFYRGIGYFQLEPGFGAPDDTAAEMRGRCGMALARLGGPEIFFHLGALAMDPEPQARSAAVKALVHLGSRQSELLLRMKILAGETHPDIMSECFSGLIAIDPEHSMDFVAGFLEDTDISRVEDAAIALGESRNLQAFEILCRYRENAILSQHRQSVILPIALTRLEEAFDYLIDIIGNESVESAVRAVESLPVMGVDDAHRERIEQAVESRDERRISEEFRKHFRI